MKKKLKHGSCTQRTMFKPKLIMGSFFTFILLSMIQASPVSVQTNINLQINNASLESVIWELKEQTGFTFLYSTEDVKDIMDVDVSADNTRLETVLDECLKENGLDYSITHNTIVIMKPEAKTSLTIESNAIEIKGKITDNSGDPLPGATILEEGTLNGVTTNANGNYTLTVKGPNSKLKISFIGFTTQIIEVGSKTTINVILEESVSTLEEVVVTGIVNRKASTFTGSVTTIKGDDLKAVSTINVFESLKSLDPSLMIVDNMALGSNPNNTPELLLRGTSSFDLITEATSIKGTYGSSPNAPLFILDGFEATVEKVLDLDMDRIESITILKDASAKTIYGSKAANGVIVIETKSVTGEEIRLTYNGGVSIEAPDLSSYNLMNAAEKLQFEVDFGLYEGRIYGEDRGTNEQAVYQSRYRAVIDGVDTDWLALPLRNAVGNKHRIGFEMGSEYLKLIAGFSFNQIQGVMKGSDRTTYSGDISISYRFNKLKVRNQLSITSNISNDSPYGNFYEYAAMNPYYSPYDRDGNIVEHPPLKEGLDQHADRYYVGNPLYNSTVGSVLQNKYLDVTNNLYAEYFWTDNLKSSLRLGIGIKNTAGDEFYPANHTMFRRYTTDELVWRRGSYQVNDGEGKTISGDFNITYSKSFNKHFMMFNVGGQFYENSFEELIYRGEGFPSEDMNSMMFARQYATNTKPTGLEQTTREIGGLAIFNYAYDERLLFDASVRSTGSSQYGSNRRWGTFWSTGIGWNVHNESWMNKEIIQLLKLRGSIGTTGSQPPRAYAGIAAYNYILDRTYSGSFGLQLMGMRNDDLLWQRKFDINVGFDLEIFKKLMLTMNVYKSITKNSVIFNSLAPSTGFYSVDENVGEVENKGIDARLTYKIWELPKERSFLNLTVTASHNRNRINKLSNAMQEYNSQIEKMYEQADRETSAPLQKYYEGASMTSIWAMQSDGIDPASGREIFVKKDGTRTFEYIASEQQIFGNTLPDIHGTVSVAFQHKGFGINLGIRYLYGGQMYNTTLARKVEAYDIKYNVDRRVLEGSWFEPGDVKPYAKHDDMVLWYSNEFGNRVYKMRGAAPTQRFVFDRNELSLSTVNISYDFWKHKFIKKMGLSRLKVSIYANNVCTWSSVRQERGTDYPFARTYNFTISASF